MNNFSPLNKHAVGHYGKKDGIGGEAPKGNDFARTSFTAATCSEATQVSFSGAKAMPAPSNANLGTAAAVATKKTKAAPKKRKFRHVWSHPVSGSRVAFSGVCFVSCRIHES